MGEAKRRGSKEERVAAGIVRQTAENVERKRLYDEAMTNRQRSMTHKQRMASLALVTALAGAQRLLK